MKKVNIIQLILAIVILGVFSCSTDTPTREFFPHSTPVIESASITPGTFVYGDFIVLESKVSDPATPLSTIECKIIVNDLLVATEVLRTPGYKAEVSGKFLVPFVANLDDNADVEVMLSLINIEGDKTVGNIAGVKAKRPILEKLYAVLENGTIIPLEKENDTYKFVSDEVSLKGNFISCKIVQKITDDNKIDFSGFVWAFDGERIEVMGDEGGNIKTTNFSLRKIREVAFDAYSFEITLKGDLIDPNQPILNPEEWGEATIPGIKLNTTTLTLKKQQEIIIEGELLNDDVYFDSNYFERVADDKVKFLGEAGTWEIYYGIKAKNVMVKNTESYGFPNALLVNGEGLSYPSKVDNAVTTGWNFDTVLSYILFKNMGNGKYQATVYLDTEKANFKPFETSGWGGEKKSDDFTLPAILINSAEKVTDPPLNGNWFAAPSAESGIYTITIDLNTRVVTAEKIAL